MLFGGERQEPFLGFALGQRVVELNEIQLLRREHARKIVVSARRVMRDADESNFALLLPSSQGLQMRAVIDQVVNLHQVHALGAQAPERLLHLAHAGVPARGPDLCRKEEPLADA